MAVLLSCWRLCGLLSSRSAATCCVQSQGHDKQFKTVSMQAPFSCVLLSRRQSKMVFFLDSSLGSHLVMKFSTPSSSTDMHSQDVSLSDILQNYQTRHIGPVMSD